MSLGIHYNTADQDLATLIRNPEVFAIEAGTLSIPQAPGLGIDIDETAVRAAAKAPHRWRNPAWRGPDGALREW